MAGTITLKTKGEAKEMPKDVQPTKKTKEGRELVPLVVGSASYSIWLPR
jgi:hypothetical protein